MLLGVIFFGPGVREARALAVEPAILDLVAEPGQSINASFLITNDERQPQAYYFSIQKFLPQGEDGDQAFLPVTETSGLPTWTYLSKSSVLLTPGRQERISFTIRVPAEASRGSVQEAIFISTVAPAPPESGVGVGVRTGILVFLRVGAVQEEWLVFMWVNRPTSWFTQLPVLIQTTIENQGGSYTIPQGTLVVRNVFGRERTRIPFNPTGSRILSGSRRSFSHVWQNHPPGVEGGFWTMVGEELSNGGFGPYTLSFEPNNETGLPMTELFRVSIWPVRLMALFAGIVSLLIIVFYGIRRRLIHRFMRASV
jgi:hypothetical protein